MFTNGWSRRDFLKGAASTAALLSLGCAPTKEELMASMKSQVSAAPPVAYPKLPYHKVQAPEKGCLVGFHKLGLPSPIREQRGKTARDASSFDNLVATFDKSWKQDDTVFGEHVANDLNYYGGYLDQFPGVFTLRGHPKLYLEFPYQQTLAASQRGVIPYLNFLPMNTDRSDLSMRLEDIASGKHDDKLTRLAKGAAAFGQKHGGFFVTTMEEMNANWYPWGMQPMFIPAWRHLWQVFEDQGANQYATWVWEPHTLAPFFRLQGKGPVLDNFWKYYPGDKYVDWIGFAAFTRDGSSGSGMEYQDLIYTEYHEARSNHPDKPIMQAETGKTRGSYQPKWLVNSFRALKEEFPGIKAWVYYDNVTMAAIPIDNKTLSPDSLQVMKEIFKDPYWIMARSA